MSNASLAQRCFFDCYVRGHFVEVILALCSYRKDLPAYNNRIPGCVFIHSFDPSFVLHDEHGCRASNRHHSVH